MSAAEVSCRLCGYTRPVTFVVYDNWTYDERGWVCVHCPRPASPLLPLEEIR